MKIILSILFLSVFLFSCEKDEFKDEDSAVILYPAEVDYSTIPYYDTYGDTLSTKPSIIYE